MGSFTKQEILSAIQRTAKQNGGKPLGEAKFKAETSITPYDWGKYWARFGDAQKDAGFTPNQLQVGHAEDFIFGKIIGLIRKLGKFPTLREIMVERNDDPELPTKNVFLRVGTKMELATKIIEYCKDKNDCVDVIQACEVVLGNSSKPAESNNSATSHFVGEVYLFKSGRYYKIGKTNDTVRRGSELRIQLPEKMDLIHSIKTDDPSGIESYWHKRFDAKRMNGEWFDLNAAEIKAFKRWKRIV